MHTLSNGLAITIALLVVACLVYDLRRSLYRILLGRTVVLVSVLYWYLLEAIRVPEAIQNYSPNENHFGLWCVALSVGVFLTAYHTSPLNLFGGLGRRLRVLDDPRVLWRMLLAGMTIGFGSLLIYVEFNVLAFFEGLTGMTRRWSGSLARERYGSWSTILYEMQMFLQAVIPLAVCLAAMRRAPWIQRLGCGSLCRLDVRADAVHWHAFGTWCPSHCVWRRHSSGGPARACVRGSCLSEYPSLSSVRFCFQPLLWPDATKDNST